MTAKIMDGRLVSGMVKENVRREVDALKEKNVTPRLAAVLVGGDPGSKSYVSMKRRDCEQVGIHSIIHELPAETGEEELVGLIEDLNADEEIHGVLVQLPLPRHIDEGRILEAISPLKDVDGLHPYNIGKLMLGRYGSETPLLPCTPKGILRLIDFYGIEVEGKNAVIVNRSNLVGKPLYKMLLDRNATVTLCHSRTRDIERHARRADILVSAVGRRFSAERPFLVTEDMVKEGAVVVDVANNFFEGKVYGDADFDRVKEKASYITPVPGGVGPMTRAMLLENTLIATKGF
ncbi:MAG: bifunctional 5,10-methylenetetrahydrofolate dehydrogenase/5,10-methenyltetrahydrofolate cyclohydrolase [Candidatus Geothermarchaeales archaeon]